MVCAGQWKWFKPERSVRFARFMFGPIGLFGPRAFGALPGRIPFPQISNGTCGSGLRPGARSRGRMEVDADGVFIILLCGGVGSILGPVHLATWLVTPRTCRSARLS